MNWFRKHSDTISILVVVVGAAMWMKSSLHQLENDLNAKFAIVEKDLAVLKTVLIMKNIMPSELAKQDLNK